MYPLYSVQVTFCTDDDDDDRMIGGRADEKDISWEVVCKTGVALLPIFHTRLPAKVWHPMTRGAKISRGAISRFEQKKLLDWNVERHDEDIELQQTFDISRSLSIHLPPTRSEDPSLTGFHKVWFVKVLNFLSRCWQFRCDILKILSSNETLQW